LSLPQGHMALAFNRAANITVKLLPRLTNTFCIRIFIHRIYIYLLLIKVMKSISS